MHSLVRKYGTMQQALLINRDLLVTRGKRSARAVTGKRGALITSDSDIHENIQERLHVAFDIMYEWIAKDEKSFE